MAMTMRNSIFCLLPAPFWFLAWLTLWPWRWKLYVPLKRWLTVTRLRGVIFQKVQLFITQVYLLEFLLSVQWDVCCDVDYCLSRYWSRWGQWWPTGWGTVEWVGAKHSVYTTVVLTTISGWWWIISASKRGHLRVYLRTNYCGSLNSCQDISELRTRLKSWGNNLIGQVTTVFTFQIHIISVDKGNLQLNTETGEYSEMWPSACNWRISATSLFFKRFPLFESCS